MLDRIVGSDVRAFLDTRQRKSRPGLAPAAAKASDVSARRDCVRLHTSVASHHRLPLLLRGEAAAVSAIYAAV